MENNQPTSGAVPTPAEARASLAGLDADGARLAERVVTPWWYHPILGAIVAAFVVAIAMPAPWASVVLVGGVLGIVALVLAYRRHAGVGTSQTGGPRSRRALAVFVVVLVVLLLASLSIRLWSELSPWWSLVPAALALVATVALGRRYDAVLRSELATRASRP